MSQPSIAPTADERVGLAAVDSRLATAVVVARLRAERSTSLRVSGWSMYPFLTPGQDVLLESCAADELRPGELVAFERAGRVILHRVLSVYPGTGQIIEKGDNVRQASVVEKHEVLGRATAVLVPRRPVELTRYCHVRAGRWLARLSAVHAGLHRFASEHRLTGRPLAFGFTVLLRLAGALAKPARAY
jgi:hypothetical protein